MLTTIVGYKSKKKIWEDRGVANKQKEKAEEMMRKNNNNNNNNFIGTLN